LADHQRLRPHLVRAAGGTHPPDGLAGRRDPVRSAGHPTRRTGRRHRHRPHAAGAGHRGPPRRAKLGGAAHLHPRSQPGVRLGRDGGGVLLVRRPGRLRHPDLAGGRTAGGGPGAGARSGPGGRDRGSDRSEALLLPLPLRAWAAKRTKGGGRGSAGTVLRCDTGTDPSPQPWSASRPKPTRGGGDTHWRARWLSLCCAATRHPPGITGPACRSMPR
jgi:hypothetical protein